MGSMLICNYSDIHDNYTYLQITCTGSPYPHNLTCLLPVTLKCTPARDARSRPQAVSQYPRPTDLQAT
jgi:hypothetical protein